MSDRIDTRLEPDGGRSEEEWEAMSLEDLQAEWDARPTRVDRAQYKRLTRVRSEIFARTAARPPDGVTYGAGKKRGEGS